MQTVVYDGSFDGWLCAVFDVYEYRFTDVQLCVHGNIPANIFGRLHHANMDTAHSQRVWKGLRQRVSARALDGIYRAFLSERMDNTLLRYVQYVFSSKQSIEYDYSNATVLDVSQMAKKVWREKHRMEAFVRFEKMGDGLYYAAVEPDYNVLPLIADHFQKRYADQRWMIFDARRKYGIYYDMETVEYVQVNFSDDTDSGKNISAIYDENEQMYQVLWKQYFQSVNIAARKNMKLHLQHMPRRYWRRLTEKH